MKFRILMEPSQNSLLSDATFPIFNQITPEQIKPAIDTLLAQNRTTLSTLLPTEKPSWDNLIAPLDEMGDKLVHAWSIVKHLKSVTHSEKLTDAYNACLPTVSDYFTELSQNTDLYEAYKTLITSPDFSRLSEPQQKAIQNQLRDFKLAGVHLIEKEKKQYAEMVKQLSKLENQFEDNLIKATDKWSYYTENASELEGIPELTLTRAKQLADKEGLSGWTLTLDFPTYYAVVTYAKNRSLREKMYTAYMTRASDQGPQAGQFDNSSIMNQILDLRHQLAKLLGFQNYAELSLATKMVKEPEDVFNFLENLVDRCQKRAKIEFDELKAFAKSEGVEDFAVWDAAYFSEKLKASRFSFNSEELRPYFPENTVIKGLFQVASRLFHIEIQEESPPHPWHPDVRFFSISQDGKNIGYFYLDIYARPNKRSGAWMDECRGRRKKLNHEIQNPIAYLVCNFNPPVDSKETLLSHDEVMTLFHEFGHGLQHLLTTIDVGEVSGIQGIAWDAVELPSQFMEHWCWDFETLQNLSSHKDTQEKLPKALYEKMLAGRHFQSGMQLLKQLEYSLFDFHLHHDNATNKEHFVQETINRIRQKIALMPIPPFNRFQHGFSHIFAGGYAAGYYSYLWAEVLACDAFSKFEENGIFDRDTGLLFRNTILALGGSKDPEEVFHAFRGREPSMDALLKYRGIST